MALLVCAAAALLIAGGACSDDSRQISHIGNTGTQGAKSESFSLPKDIETAQEPQIELNAPDNTQSNRTEMKDIQTVEEDNMQGDCLEKNKDLKLDRKESHNRLSQVKEKIRYYTSRLHSENIVLRQDDARKLLDMNEKEPVFEYYTERYSSKEVQKRWEVVEELRGVDKDIMKEIFRNRCYSEQVRIPAGTLKLQNGTEVRIPSLWVDKYEVTIENILMYIMFAKKNHLKKQVLLSVPKITPREGASGYWAQLCPISHISWQDAKAYAEFLGMRLPTEYEWKYVIKKADSAGLLFRKGKEYPWYEERDLPNGFGFRCVRDVK
jgi:hypothetical protein